MKNIFYKLLISIFALILCCYLYIKLNRKEYFVEEKKNFDKEIVTFEEKNENIVVEDKQLINKNNLEDNNIALSCSIRLEKNITINKNLKNILSKYQNNQSFSNEILELESYLEPEERKILEKIKKHDFQNNKNSKNFLNKLIQVTAKEDEREFFESFYLIWELANKK